MRRPPNFWARPPGFVSNLLLPAGMCWDAAGRLRRAIVRPHQEAVPVVCIGNLVAGGAGKTPVALALASHLAGSGIALHILTRGYGGRLSGPVRVDPAHHDAAAVGDEALLLAARAPCWVARDRADGIRAAVAAGAQLIVLDDGYQNPAVAKTLSIVVVDEEYGFGNGRVIPAGPLREDLARGLARADAVVLLGAEKWRHDPAALGIKADLPVLGAALRPVDDGRFAGMRAVAFAGIGRPDKFFATLRQLGAELIETRSFPDHHPFRDAEIDDLIRAAKRAQARLTTTAKDIVRVPVEKRFQIEVLEVEIRWSDPGALEDLIRSVWGARRCNDGR
jgi:tetraacyldisaccharide 4'-kinase